MRQTLLKTTKLLQKRTMSTKIQWLVIVSDFPGMIQKRIEVRQAHLSVVEQNQAVRAGGPTTQAPRK